MTSPGRSHTHELVVLGLISGGLLVVLLAIIAGLFGWFKARSNVPLPNWAENVLVAMSTAAILKLGDALAALVTLATGRQVESYGAALANSAPVKRLPPPPPAGDEAAAAAAETAEAAADQAAEIADRSEGK